MWVTFQDESLVSSIFVRQAELRRESIRLLKYIPHWCYKRNKELEILCRMERERDPNLRTKVLLGHRDLKLNIKKKGDPQYKRVSVEYFGRLPNFNFHRAPELSPGSPEGRRKYSSDEEQSTSRKRNVRSDSESPRRPLASRPRIGDISHDEILE